MAYKYLSFYTSYFTSWICPTSWSVCWHLNVSLRSARGGSPLGLLLVNLAAKGNYGLFHRCGNIHLPVPAQPINQIHRQVFHIHWTCLQETLADIDILRIHSLIVFTTVLSESSSVGRTFYSCFVQGESEEPAQVPGFSGQEEGPLHADPSPGRRGTPVSISGAPFPLHLAVRGERPAGT